MPWKVSIPVLRAISAFNVIAGQFSRIVEDMPEQTRWHAELLLYELEERQFTVDALDSFNKVALSAESLSQTAQTLPADLRKEVTLALQDFESQQQQLQQTLNTLDGTIERATLMLDSVYAAGDNVAQAGESWREVFETIGALGGDKSEDPSEPSRPFDIREYTATAERLTEAAAELRSLVNEINQTLQNEKVSTLPRSGITGRRDARPQRHRPRRLARAATDGRRIHLDDRLPLESANGSGVNPRPEPRIL